MNPDLQAGRFTIAECSVQILDYRDEDDNIYRVLRVFEDDGDMPIEINLQSLNDKEKDKLENQINAIWQAVLENLNSLMEDDEDES